MAEKQYDWAAIAQNPKFKELHHKKSAFLFGWWIFSTAYYFLLPIGAAYTPGLFKIKVTFSPFPSFSYPGDWLITTHMSPTRTLTE